MCPVLAVLKREIGALILEMSCWGPIPGASCSTLSVPASPKKRTLDETTIVSIYQGSTLLSTLKREVPAGS